MSFPSPGSNSPLQQGTPNLSTPAEAGAHPHIVFLPDYTQRRAAMVLAVLSLFSCGTLCMSNIMALKVWQVGPFILDGGLLVFPMLYVIDDVLSELFRQKIANIIKFYCCVVDVILVMLLSATRFLPSAPGIDGIDPSTALGGLPLRITLASALAAFLSGCVNNAIHDYLHKRAADEYTGLGSRAWWSSVVAHFPDSAIFTFLAFGGINASLAGLCQQAITSYIASVIVEAAFLPLTVWTGKRLKKFLASPLR